MPASAADTLRILIATDSHVGYNERDPIRGDDSWKTFDEVMQLAKTHDVDMVLLSGDLFHDNKPSRKAMYQVMKSLRENCIGEKPCELEILSDTSQVFQSAGGRVNYEDPDINVAIPVFSIHGNHDDPSGEGRFCALDLLSIAGLVNYFGRIPENDNITVSPVLLQKGGTKLALYGLSNVRDERLFRTFRDGKVKFMRPGVQQKEWFNLMCVHQNHYGHTETSYLPENFLPEFLDLVIWGHEHECLIEPRLNPETNFSVIQPGSSVATSLSLGEAIPKHAGILAITGKSFALEKKIRLKTVRPFIMKELVLADEPEMEGVWNKNSNKTQVTQFLCLVVEELIEEAGNEWMEAQKDGEEDTDEEELRSRKPPLPLVRLRVEYSAPEGGKFEIENPQRFSNRFVGKVANVSDVIQFHRKKTNVRRGKVGEDTNISLDTTLDDYGGSIENVKVEDLVKEFLDNTTLEILPSNGLGDAVGQFVDKDDKHAVEVFVADSLKTYMLKLKEYEELNEETIDEVVRGHKSYLEELFEKGLVKNKRSRKKLKPKPDEWDSDFDGNWADQPAAQLTNTEAQDDDDELPQRAIKSTRGRGRSTTASSRGKAAVAKKSTTFGRGRKKVVQEEDEDEEDEVMDVDNDEEEEEIRPLAKTRKPAAKPAPAPKTRTTTAAKKPAARKPAAVSPQPRTRQSKLNFGVQQTQSRGKTQTQRAVIIPSDDEDIDDEEDEFVPIISQKRR